MWSPGVWGLVLSLRGRWVKMKRGKRGQREVGVRGSLVPRGSKWELLLEPA